MQTPDNLLLLTAQDPYWVGRQGGPLRHHAAAATSFVLRYPCPPWQFFESSVEKHLHYIYIPVSGIAGLMGVMATSYPSLRRALARIRARCLRTLGSDSVPCSMNRTPSCKIFQITRQSRWAMAQMADW